MVETGQSIVEAGIITRVAEGAIAFAAGVQYAPVIQGSTADQVKAATDSSKTVIGFVKKPMTADSVVDGDTVDVVTEGSIIKVHVTETVAINDLLEVHATVTQLNKISIDVATTTTLLASLQVRCAKVLSPRTGAGVTWVCVGGY